MRDKSRERIIKLVKGKTTRCPSEIFKRHCEAQNMNNYILELSGVNVWKLTKESKETYIVTQTKESNCCLEMCSVCNICRHTYTCSFVDFNCKRLICRHIHYVVFHTLQRPVVTQKSENEHKGIVDLFCSEVCKPKETMEHKLNNKVNQTFCKLQNFDYSTLDDSALERILYHLNIVDNLTNLPKIINKEENNFISQGDTNKRYIDAQLHFLSTKKKRKSSASATITFSDMERLDMKNIMLQNESTLVISKNPAEDHLYCEI